MQQSQICCQKLRLSSTTHLEISEAHLRSVSQFLGLRIILSHPSSNAAFSQVRFEENIKSHGFCSDISHFFRLILTEKKSSMFRVPILNGLARKQPQLISQNLTLTWLTLHSSCAALKLTACILSGEV